MTTETETPDEAEALQNLENLDSVEPDDSGDDAWVDQAEAERQAADDEAAKKRAAEQGAAWAIGAAEGVLKMRYPFIQVDDQTRENLNEKTAAVLYKHGGGLPPWLEPYREEIELGIALGTAGFVVYLQVQAHEQAEAERQANDQGEGGAYAYQAE